MYSVVLPPSLMIYLAISTPSSRWSKLTWPPTCSPFRSVRVEHHGKPSSASTRVHLYWFVVSFVLKYKVVKSSQGQTIATPCKRHKYKEPTRGTRDPSIWTGKHRKPRDLLLQWLCIEKLVCFQSVSLPRRKCLYLNQSPWSSRLCRLPSDCRRPWQADI